MPGPGGAAAFDKVALKTAGWDAARFTAAGFRLVPGALVRRSAYIAPGVVVMPSFINVGAYIGHGSMIDTGRPSEAVPRSAATAISAGGRASAACWSRCRRHR